MHTAGKRYCGAAGKKIDALRSHGKLRIFVPGQFIDTWAQARFLASEGLFFYTVWRYNHSQIFD